MFCVWFIWMMKRVLLGEFCFESGGFGIGNGVREI